ncbi:Uncharacterised protein [Bordetella pertussis]|nr:Uncharacterised protein [Bordetella pertussis]CFV98247.1 Uncharacterised protein [Bordetella pertussis]
MPRVSGTDRFREKCATLGCGPPGGAAKAPSQRPRGAACRRSRTRKSPCSRSSSGSPRRTTHMGTPGLARATSRMALASCTWPARSALLNTTRSASAICWAASGCTISCSRTCCASTMAIAP